MINENAVRGIILLGLLGCAVIGYLLGSVNTAIIVTWAFKQKEDIRDYGSGNAGMTNVLRSVGKLPALLTFIGDFLKCVCAVLLAWLIMFLVLHAALDGGDSVELMQIGKYIAGVACILGHIYPLYYRFRGGKAVVSSAAMILLLDWRVFLLIIATFLLMFIWKRIVSLASITCAAAYPIYTFLISFFCDFRAGRCSLGYLLFVTGVSLFIGALVLFKHRSNIGRLRRGEEKPVAFGKK